MRNFLDGRTFLRYVIAYFDNDMNIVLTHHLNVINLYNYNY